MSGTIQIYPDPQQLAQSATEIVISTMQKAIQNTGRCSISLSGGSTPRQLYELLAQPGNASKIEWSKVTVFWGDERCVPPDHQDSDYLMVCQALLDHLPVDHQPTVHRMPGEIDPIDAARRYEQILREYFGSNATATFNVLLLGMGEDGHTASLFPHTPPIHETARWVIGHYVDKLSGWRLTLTPPILNLSQLTIFLVAGSGKAAMLKQVLRGPYLPDEFPSQSIRPVNQNLVWLIDQAAASQVG
jgi:6-phosphogluconolactonase